MAVQQKKIIIFAKSQGNSVTINNTSNVSSSAGLALTRGFPHLPSSIMVNTTGASGNIQCFVRGSVPTSASMNSGTQVPPRPQFIFQPNAQQGAPSKSRASVIQVIENKLTEDMIITILKEISNDLSLPIDVRQSATENLTIVTQLVNVLSFLNKCLVREGVASKENEWRNFHHHVSVNSSLLAGVVKNEFLCIWLPLCLFEFMVSAKPTDDVKATPVELSCVPADEAEIAIYIGGSIFFAFRLIFLSGDESILITFFSCFLVTLHFGVICNASDL
jgi:hypothetical protein